MQVGTNSPFEDRLEPLPDLPAAVLQLIRSIPPGTVTTYGDLARALGDPDSRAARWIGDFLKNAQHPAPCNCHRVVRANGEVGHYAHGSSLQKRSRLIREGISVSPAGIVSLDHRRTDFAGRQPLAELRRSQLGWVKELVLCPLERSPRTIAAVDVAYPSTGQAQGAYVEFDTTTRRQIYEQNIQMAVDFPYLPGYLTFRELPVLLRLLDHVRQSRTLADVLLVDGNGILHPWSAGLATCLGVLIDRPTIGVGKSLLCGTVDLQGMTELESRPVIFKHRQIGAALKNRSAHRPVFVSPGHRIVMEEAVQMCRETMTRHRVPEPIFVADRNSKRRVHSTTSTE